ncbi:MAG: ABC transporter substrate-binding protein [Thermomicrobiales bacterium]|nr:ABC transporter substrate-binding protein [Thermomicrobiales bacterium]
MRSRIRWKRPMQWIGIVALMIGLIAPSVALAQDSSPESGGGVLIGAFDVGPGGCPECPNPLQAGAGFTWYEKYFSKLMLYTPDFSEIQGELAESWELNEDATQYTIHLRDGVLWHDGEPFTAADVKFTIETAAHPDSASYIGAKFVGVTSIETPDDLTVILNLDEGNVTLLDAFTFLVMLPEHALADISPADLTTSSWWLDNPIGTGPFKWKAYEPGQYIELEAFEDYWRGRPQLDGIINRFFPEAGSSVIALRSGDIQFTYMTLDEALGLEGEEGLSVIAGPSQVLNYLGFDLTDPRFTDQRVRQAFMYAIDRPTIVEQLYGGQATMANCGFILPQFVPDGLNDYAQDVEMASQLLSDAGFDASQPVEILTYYGDQLSQDVLVTIQQFMADAGVNVEIRVVDVPTYNQITPDPEQWDITFAGAANGPDPDVLSSHFESIESNPSVLNRSNIKDDQLDALFADGRSTVDTDARAEVYQQICQIMNDQVYWAPLWVATRFGGASDQIENFVWVPAPGGGRYYDQAELWSLAA